MKENKMSLVTFAWLLLGLQTIWLGISYTYETRERKKGSKGSFLRNWWKSLLGLTLWIVDCGLVGFFKGIEPYTGA